MLKWRLFGCDHNWSFPITIRIRGYKITYRRCMSCGERRKYDWDRMKFVEFSQQENRDLTCPSYGQTGIKV